MGTPEGMLRVKEREACFFSLVGSIWGGACQNEPGFQYPGLLLAGKQGIGLALPAHFLLMFLGLICTP